MSYLFTVLWLVTCVAIVVFGIKYVKVILIEKNILKENKKSKYTSGQLKKKMISLIIASVIFFIAVGVTAPNIDETQNVNSVQNETVGKQENLIEKEKIEEKEEKKNDYNIVKVSNNNTTKNDLESLKNNTLSNIPEYSGKPYVAINNNVPFFSDDELTVNSFENYSNLDNLGRCQVAIASIGKDIMPTEKRGRIGEIKPSGWHSVRYQGIDGNYLYNRCHLIGFQLAGENANTKNLITGTRYLNVEGMLPFENMVADYVKETNNHVLYRVTPIFKDNNLIASGVLIEAKSVEDKGNGILFNVYCYNVQPGITINYENGDSSGPEYLGTTTQANTNRVVTPNKVSTTSENESSKTYILNTNSKKFHYSNCRSVSKMSEKNKETFNGDRSDILSRGYSPCGICHP